MRDGDGEGAEADLFEGFHQRCRAAEAKEFPDVGGGGEEHGGGGYEGEGYRESWRCVGGERGLAAGCAFEREAGVDGEDGGGAVEG